jgi:DNA-binding transcriptional LysR family regulator
MVIGILPCFIGDIDPELVRIPPYTSEGKYDLWVLSHPDLRKNAKIQTFVRFMTEFVQEKKELL